MAFEKGNPFVGFSLGFTASPRKDFGVFATGYHHAAQQLSETLLAKLHFPDYEAYPVVFLYRHALELSLKNIIYKAALLSAFRRMDDIDSKLYKQHKLPPLATRARHILLKLFPKDLDLKLIADDLLDVAREISVIDDSSYVYRYPIRPDGSPSVARTQTVNLVDLSSRMNSILNQLEVIDFGLNLETEMAQDIYEIVESITAEDEDEQSSWGELLTPPSHTTPDKSGSMT